MGTKTPTVWQDIGRGTMTLDAGVHLDTPAWFSWLEEATTRSFAYPIYNAAQGYIAAFLTIRKERRQRGTAYWTAYSHVGGRLRKAYIGRSPAVTDARLRAIAATFLDTMADEPGRPDQRQTGQVS
jgi:hypothetical protein